MFVVLDLAFEKGPTKSLAVEIIGRTFDNVFLKARRILGVDSRIDSP